MRTGGRGIVRVCVNLRVEGRELLPPAGPVIVAARHFHHVFDGCVLISAVPRPLHFVVAVDWLTRPVRRTATEHWLAAAHWPRIVRADGLVSTTRDVDPAVQVRYLRGAVAEGLRVLAAGHVLVFFPEGHPTVDPGETPKKGDDAAFLAFQPGFSRLAEIATRRLGVPVPIVPAGLEFRRGRRWRIVLRFGEPIAPGCADDREATVRSIEDAVRRLSGLPAKSDDLIASASTLGRSTDAPAGVVRHGRAVGDDGATTVAACADADSRVAYPARGGRCGRKVRSG
jgi:putative membrane protein